MYVYIHIYIYIYIYKYIYTYLNEVPFYSTKPDIIIGIWNDNLRNTTHRAPEIIKVCVATTGVSDFLAHRRCGVVQLKNKIK